MQDLNVMYETRNLPWHVFNSPRLDIIAHWYRLVPKNSVHEILLNYIENSL